MAQTGEEVVIDIEGLQEMFRAIKHVLKTDALPYDLSYSCTRVLPRIKEDHEEVVEENKRLLKDHGKRNEEGLYEMIGRTVRFKTEKDEDDYNRKLKEANSKPYTFTTYCCPLSVLDEIKASYRGALWFLEPLLGTIIVNPEDLKKDKAERERIAIEAANNGSSGKKVSKTK